LRRTGPHCDRTLQILLKTLIDILLFRKAPDSLPHSWILFYATFFSATLLSILATAIIVPDLVVRYDISLALVCALCAYYSGVLWFTGFTARTLQTLSAVLGTESVLTMTLIPVYALLKVATDHITALLLVFILGFWSIPVQGHIIARAIRQPWGVGFVLAIIGYLLLFSVEDLMSGPA
jgi:hypothetical protein